MKNVIDILEERGLIEASTSNEMRSITQKPLKVYCGFDPTADSLHLGNMVALMGLAWFQMAGHTPVAIVGGATGLVGDPSGKSVERPLLDQISLQKNLDGIRRNVESFLRFGSEANKPLILNNYDWFRQFDVIGFLRDVGRYFRLGPMLAKDSVKARLNSPEGMSFTEFSYQLLQGYDFLHLYREHGVTVQLGGSDQWGNIIAGTDLIRKATGAAAHGVTFPLLTRSDGQKFGKSEQGAIWLSAEKLSPYEFYQYLVRVADADVIKLMRMLTFMDMAEIAAIEASMVQSNYAPNSAQKRLAAEVTRIVHGDEQLAVALKVTEAAAPGASTELNAETLEAIAADMPSKVLLKEQVVGVKLVDLLCNIGLQPSKGEARRIITNGGVYINNTKVTDAQLTIDAQHLIENRLLLLAVGKKNKMLVRVANG